VDELADYGLRHPPTGVGALRDPVQQSFADGEPPAILRRCSTEANSSAEYAAAKRTGAAPPSLPAELINPPAGGRGRITYQGIKIQNGNPGSKVLHLANVGAQCAQLAEQAVRERRTHLSFLEALLQAELEEREQRLIARPIRESASAADEDS
jgi:hypothetical protein